MAITSFPNVNVAQFSQLGSGGLLRTLEKTGQSPPISIIIKPLDGSQVIALDRFMSYQFSSNILIPVDSFSFTFAFPDGPPLNQVIKEGDIITLTANDVPIATGIIDQTEFDLDADAGERASITGRDLMGQLEDQDAVSIQSKQIYAKDITVKGGVDLIIENTKIKSVELRDAPQAKYLLATEPSESKLQGLLRFLEPLNCVAWMGSSGQLIIGKPNMAQPSKGALIASRSQRSSNVLSIRVVRSSTQIANMLFPVWTGQESVVARVAPEGVLNNAAPGPDRLRKLGYLVPKTVVVSAPNATDPQGLAGINQITAAGAGNLLQAYVKREAARQNINEIQVHAIVQGHFNEAGEPYVVDTVYKITVEREGLDEEMYLYGVEYELTDDGGQRTTLQFCRFGAIVGDIRAP